MEEVGLLGLPGARVLDGLGHVCDGEYRVWRNRVVRTVLASKNKVYEEGDIVEKWKAENTLFNSFFFHRGK